MGNPELDPAQLRRELEDWRQQATHAAPLRLAVIDTLLAKAQTQRPAVAEQLYRRVSETLPALIAQCQAEPMAPRSTTVKPSPLADFVQQWQQTIQQQDVIPSSPLEEKIRAQNARYLGEVAAPEPTASPESESSQGLRAAQRLQQRQGVQVKRRKVELALSKRPKNPGPLNPQMLAVKLLSEIQQSSPDYLERLVVFVETLTALETLDKKFNKKSGKT
ncbi:DUF2894 domain-containing protein [Spongiibacter nanhainus]|uniref:DUF2894 domain-containing protein n=1 Tax=Spongiibacter nanhainus TaxID=2794344 RepID=A0A7T4UQX4_9GAMM|nr:DUF2894 domain-containing protein [Spongiibacter nanhainus]QQD18653.1 DUF2894 domain-containing protein [Spongiibacter nanhainus]